MTKQRCLVFAILLDIFYWEIEMLMSLNSIEPAFLEDRHILLDCDGVLLNYLGGFRPFCERQGIIPDGPEPSSWDLSGWLGVDGPTVGKLINTFNEEDDSFQYLEPFDHALRGIKMLKEAGWTMSIITSVTTSLRRQEMRLRNLERHFGADTFKCVVFLDATADKHAVLSEYSPSLWVEDNYKNALAGTNAGHQAVVINHAVNADHKPTSHPSIIWCDGVDEIATAVLALESDLEMAPAGV